MNTKKEQKTNLIFSENLLFLPSPQSNVSLCRKKYISFIMSSTLFLILLGLVTVVIVFLVEIFLSVLSTLLEIFWFTTVDTTFLLRFILSYCWGSDITTFTHVSINFKIRIFTWIIIIFTFQWLKWINPARPVVMAFSMYKLLKQFYF